LIFFLVNDRGTPTIDLVSCFLSLKIVNRVESHHMPVELVIHTHLAHTHTHTHTHKHTHTDIF